MSNPYSGLFSGLLGTTDEQKKIAVWIKGHPIQGYDSSVWRRDDFGHAIRFSDYGDRNSDYGWEIDHVVANALHGSDNLSNLRPLHCLRNASLGGLLGGALNR